jgi:hypothetical protein
MLYFSLVCLYYEEQPVKTVNGNDWQLLSQPNETQPTSGQALHSLLQAACSQPSGACSTLRIFFSRHIEIGRENYNVQ